MKIDGKNNVRSRVKIYENDRFITYSYEFENGNTYKESFLKWIQKDFKTNIYKTQEERLENKLDKY